MGNWRPHNACNKFDESKFVGPREMARFVITLFLKTRLKLFSDSNGSNSIFVCLKRFNHFRDRYVNQLQSLTLEGNLYRDVESKVNNMKDEFGMGSNEVSSTVNVFP